MPSIKIISPGEDFSEALKVRVPVFVKEQNIPEENELDGYDKVSYHAVLYDNEIPVACGRLYYTDETAHIGRVAVLKQYRHRGYATTVCRKLIDIAVVSNMADIITLDAQKYVVDLYKKLGFKVVGKEFLEENIPHLKMKMTIKKKIPIIDKICIVISIYSWIYILLIWFGKTYVKTYYNPSPIFEILGRVVAYSGLIYFLTYWAFIISAIAYTLLLRKKNWFFLILSTISYILFIIIVISNHMFEMNSAG